MDLLERVSVANHIREVLGSSLRMDKAAMTVFSWISSVPTASPTRHTLSSWKSTLCRPDTPSASSDSRRKACLCLFGGIKHASRKLVCCLLASAYCQLLVASPVFLRASLCTAAWDSENCCYQRSHRACVEMRAKPSPGRPKEAGTARYRLLSVH